MDEAYQPILAWLDKEFPGAAYPSEHWPKDDASEYLPAGFRVPELEHEPVEMFAKRDALRRSNIAPLALATRLGEECREDRLHRPRLAFRAGGAPLAVRADRLLEAEALPTPGAAVFVDWHRRWKVIPA